MNVRRPPWISTSSSSARARAAGARPFRARSWASASAWSSGVSGWAASRATPASCPPRRCARRSSRTSRAAAPTCPTRCTATGVDFDDGRVIDSDGILRLEEHVPRTMTVVGAGVIGVESMSIFAAMGTRVALVDARDRLLPHVDREITVALQHLRRKRNVAVRFGEEVTHRPGADGTARARWTSSSPRCSTPRPRPRPTRSWGWTR